HCDRVVPGFTLHVQFISLGPAAGQHGLSNPATFTFVDSGNCVPGQHIAFTESDYDGACPGSNAACLLLSHFATVFPQGLILGDPDGIDGDAQYAEVFTSAAAVQAFQPAASSLHPFFADALNPVDSEAGDLAGQLAIAKLNVGFDDAGALNPYKA